MSWWHRHVVFPSILRVSGLSAVKANLAQLRGLQFVSADELRRRQLEALGDIVSYAAARSPYYRSTLAQDTDSKIDPEKRLVEVPFVTKLDLQRHADAMRVPDFRGRLDRKTTGGSTGQPVTVYKDRDAVAHEMASTWLAYGWFGVRIGDRAARFWGEPTTGRRRVRYAAADFAMHRIRLSAFGFDDEALERYWSRCMAFRPRYLYGYVSMLVAFASYVRRRGYDGHALGLKVIVSTAEALGEPDRALIEEALGAPVQNEYGCGEVGPIAYQCEHRSLHLMTENVFVEVLRADGSPVGPQEIGEIVVTDLHNRAAPLIRYRLGDLAELGERCACGRGFPVLKRVVGRAYDLIETADGRRYHGEFFMYVFEDLRERGVVVDQFQITQLAPDRLDVAAVLRGTTGEEDAVAQEMERRLPGTHVSVRRVTEIPRLPSGKMQLIRRANGAGAA